MTEPRRPGELSRYAHSAALPCIGSAPENAAQSAEVSPSPSSAEDHESRRHALATPHIAAVTDRSGHIAALDGVRALAVAAVLLYHAGIAGVRGGFLGVDVFFVLSGYLITGLLAREFLASGRLDLRRFYLRRARRLLPALFTVLVVTCVVVVVWLPEEAAGFRSDVTASAAYVTNWWFVVQGQSYFGGTGRPSLLRHLWSLAVEEQFYLLWPMFFVVMIGRTARVDATIEERVRYLWRAVGWASLFGICSVVLTAVLYSPWRDPSRIYYGTDTRAFEILAGVLLALGQVARQAVRQPVRQVTRSLIPPGETHKARRLKVALREGPALLALTALLCAFAEVPATSPALYPVGLVAVSLLTAVLISGLVAGCAVADILASRPLVWLGQRSYALYLWHWPVFAVTRPGIDVTWPAPLVFAVRILLPVALTELTYRFVEQPIRGGALTRAAGRAAQALRAREYGLPALAAGGTLAVAGGTVWLAGLLSSTAAAHPADARAVAMDTGPAASLISTPPDAPQAGTPGKATHGTSPHGRASATTAPYPTALPDPPAHPPRVAVIGDSQAMTLVLNRPPDTAVFLDLFDDSTEGCGLLGGRITSRSGERRDLDADCGEPAEKWAARAARDRADIALMMIGAWDLFDEKVDGADLPFGTPGWDAYFTTRLDRAVGELHSAGVPRVALSLLPCYRPFHSSAGSWPERGEDERVQHVNALLTAFTQDAAHHAEPLVPPPSFCEDPVVSASRAYRWDGVHYYKPGARLYLQTAIPQLLARQ